MSQLLSSAGESSGSPVHHRLYRLVVQQYSSGVLANHVKAQSSLSGVIKKMQFVLGKQIDFLTR